jgi:hypothetical protein
LFKIIFQTTKKNLIYKIYDWYTKRWNLIMSESDSDFSAEALLYSEHPLQSRLMVMVEALDQVDNLDSSSHCHLLGLGHLLTSSRPHINLLLTFQGFSSLLVHFIFDPQPANLCPPKATQSFKEI